MSDTESTTEGGFESRADQDRADAQPQAPMGDRAAGGEPDIKGERGEGSGAGVLPLPETDPEDADIAADDVGASAMAEARAKSADDA